MVFSILLCGLLTTGRHFREIDVDEDWLPKDSELRERNEYVSSVYSQDDSRYTILEIRSRAIFLYVVYEWYINRRRFCSFLHAFSA